MYPSPDNDRWVHEPSTGKAVSPTDLILPDTVYGQTYTIEVPSSQKEISFTITPGRFGTSISCKAKEGMTQQEWVDSDYNTCSATITTNGYLVVNNYMSVGVTATDTISSGSYVLNEPMKTQLA